MSSYQGTHALLMSALYERQMNLNWHRSKDTMPGKPAYVGGGYMSNKKWPLIEEWNFHVCLKYPTLGVIAISYLSF